MHGLDTKTSGIPCATPYSHRPVQKLLALIGNPRSSQQLMGQLPIFGCLRQKSSMISRARAWASCVRECRPAPLAATNAGRTPAFAFSNIHEVGMVCLGTTERRNRYRYPQILSVSDMPACLVHSHGRETTIRPFATEKLSDK